jgi:hypothetical protein
MSQPCHTSFEDNTMRVTRDSITNTDLNFHNQHTTYATHGLHPYGAKFPPQLAGWAVETFSQPGELVLDCFSGGGTLLVEGRLLGRSVAGVDIDPLAQRVSLAKAVPLESTRLCRASSRLRKHVEEATALLADNYPGLIDAECPPDELLVDGHRISVPNFPRRDFWFHPKVSAELALIMHLIDRIQDQDVRRLLEVVLSSCVISKGKGSVANVADLVHTRPHYVPKLAPPSVIETFLQQLSRAQKAMRDFSDHVDRRMCTHWAGEDARGGVQMKDGEAYLIVTSPPYVNALDYPRAHRFSLYWMGISPEDYHELTYDHIGLQRAPMRQWEAIADEQVGVSSIDQYIAQVTARDVKSASLIKQYFLDIRASLVEMQRVLARRRYAVLAIGESTVNGNRVPSPDFIGFRHYHTLARRLDAGKRYLPFRASGMSGGIREEKVLIFQKR